MAVGIAFGFSSINLNLVSSLLILNAQHPQLAYEEVEKALGLNRPKVEGYNNFMRHLGLTQYTKGERKRELTDIGQKILQHDPHLQDIGTLCAFHYLLCGSPEAEVWHFVSNEFITGHRSFSREELSEAIAKKGIGQHSPKHLSGDISLLLSAYTSAEHRALQSIDYLKKEGDRYVAYPVERVPVLVLGFALYRQRLRGTLTTTMSINSLLALDGQVGKVFLLQREQLMVKLRQLEAKGILGINQISHLDNISFASGQDGPSLLERYYRERE